MPSAKEPEIQKLEVTPGVVIRWAVAGYNPSVLCRVGFHKYVFARRCDDLCYARCGSCNKRTVWKTSLLSTLVPDRNWLISGRFTDEINPRRPEDSQTIKR